MASPYTSPLTVVRDVETVYIPRASFCGPKERKQSKNGSGGELPEALNKLQHREEEVQNGLINILSEKGQFREVCP